MKSLSKHGGKPPKQLAEEIEGLLDDAWASEKSLHGRTHHAVMDRVRALVKQTRRPKKRAYVEKRGLKLVRRT